MTVAAGFPEGLAPGQAGLSRAACVHCAAPLMPGQGEFCCTGCAGAHALVRGLGLDAFYRRREMPAGLLRPAEPGMADPVTTDFAAHARDKGTTPAHLAIGWVLNNRLVTGVIGGPRTTEQWDDYIAALDAPFTADDEALFDRLVAAGHPSTPGYTDPAYPLEGRVSRV